MNNSNDYDYTDLYTREAFKLHIKEIFDNYSEQSLINEEIKDNLSDIQIDFQKNDSNTMYNIPRINFLKYLRDLPIFISDKLFKSLDINKRGCITYDDFAHMFMTLKYSTEEELLDFFFKIFVFDINDKEIFVSDIKLLMSYIPFSSNNTENTENDYFEYQLENTSELDKLIEDTFHKQIKVNSSEFKTLLQENGDLFLLFINYLYLFIPAFKKSLTFYKIVLQASNQSNNLNHLNDLNGVSTLCSLNRSLSIGSKIDLQLELKPDREISSRSFKFTFNSSSLFGSKKNSTKSYDSESIKIKDFIEEENYKTITNITNSISDIPSIIIESNQGSIIDNNCQYKSIITYEDYIFTTSNNTENKKRNTCNNNLNNKTKTKTFNENLQENINETNESTLLLNYIRFIDGNLYLYKQKDENIENYYKTIILHGSNLMKSPKKNIQGESYFSLTLFLNNNLEEVLYTKSEDIYNSLIKVIRESIHYTNFFDNYIIRSQIGAGAYGDVFLSEDKKTKRIVATKIISKNKDKRNNWIQVKTEIDVLKKVNHPNIVKLIETYENSKFHFIVMEYSKYGRLTKFFQQKYYKVNENIIIRISYQIAQALKYLHSLGVVHRDLKPDNILIDYYNNNSEKDIKIKLIDFGFAKILSKNNTVTERFGSLGFSAPELLLRKQYAFSVDVWSFGINMFYFFTGKFPFKIYKDNTEKTIKSICNKDFLFDIDILSERSVEAKDLILKCLVKEETKRVTINEVINHPWFSNVRNE